MGRTDERTFIVQPDSQLELFRPGEICRLGGAQVIVAGSDELDRRIVRETLKRDGYGLSEWPSVQVTPRLLVEERADLLILCIEAANGTERQTLQELKQTPATRLIPICVITSSQDEQAVVEWMNCGADDVIVKPFHPSLLRAKVKALLRHKGLTDRLEEAETILFALAQAIEYRDPAVAGHCERLAYYSTSLGKELGLGNEDLQTLYRASYLHDIGKVAIPDEILHKRGPLNAQEWAIMKQHTIRGEEICKPMRNLKRVLPVIRSHHERWDGSGYPDGLRGTEIPLLARVLQVVDIFDALTTERSYKPALSAEKALRVLEEEAARGWRDPRIVDVFVRAVREGRIRPCCGDGAVAFRLARTLKEAAVGDHEAEQATTGSTTNTAEGVGSRAVEEKQGDRG